MKQLLAASSDWRTLLILGAGVILAAALSNPFPAVAGVGVYLYAVRKLAQSPAYQEAADKIRLAEGLAARYRTLQQTVNETNQHLSRLIPPNQGRTWFTRAQDVVTAAREIYMEWQSRPEAHAAKTPIVEQALQMSTLYLRILRSYHAIYTGRSRSPNLEEVNERLTRNQRRLETITDPDARRDLTRAVEMDQRVLQQATLEVSERERYQAKLAAIESTMDILRRHVFDPEATPEGESLRDMLLEAEAMDQALDEVRQRSRVRA